MQQSKTNMSAWVSRWTSLEVRQCCPYWLSCEVEPKMSLQPSFLRALLPFRLASEFAVFLSSNHRSLRKVKLWILLSCTIHNDSFLSRVCWHPVYCCSPASQLVLWTVFRARHGQLHTSLVMLPPSTGRTTVTIRRHDVTCHKTVIFIHLHKISALEYWCCCFTVRVLARCLSWCSVTRCSLINGSKVSY